MKKLVSFILCIIMIAAMMTSLCGVASAASYASDSGMMNGYNCKATLMFNSSTWGASGGASYGTTADSMFITIRYVFRVSGTTSLRTIARSNSSSDSNTVALSVGPDISCDANVSATGSVSITAKNGASWNSRVLNID